MDPESERLEFERLEAAVDAADAAFRKHRLSGFRAWYGDDPRSGVGTGTADALGNAAWWTKYDQLKQTAEDARTASDLWWRRHHAF
jgi:hypothetical protein